MSKYTNFNPVWMTDKLYQSWLLPDEKNKHKFRCSLCNMSLDLSNMGKRALNSHIEGKKHILNAKLRTSKSMSMFQNWIQPQPSTSSSEDIIASEGMNPISNPSLTTSSQSNTLESFVTRDNVTKAEILMVLQKIMNHESFNSAEYENKTHAAMYPDSIIAQKAACGPDKCAYITVYGLAPYFHDVLLKKLTDVPCFSVSFDESFNSVTKNEQLDIAVRFYDESVSQIVSHYWQSQFLGHTKAVDLLKSFKAAFSEIDGSKIL